MKEFVHVIKGASKNSLFILLFLALIQPFGIDTIKEGRIAFIIAETVLVFVCVVVSMLITNGIMRSCIVNESLTKMIIHFGLFFLINTPLLGAALLTYTSCFNTSNPLLYWFVESSGKFNIAAWGRMSMNVSCISVIVAIIVIYQLKNNKLQQRLDEIEKINHFLDNREEEDSPKEEMIEFVGQNQKSYLKVASLNIIYVESMANYADICYISDNEIHHSTLRITLKQVREALAKVDYIVQCHRAFLVNIHFIQKLTDRNSGYQIQLFGLDKLIPISRANESIIKQKLYEDT